jgi:competence protein ComEA
LDSLSGIGPTKAQAIIDYRNQNGPFRTIDDLLNVTGIGPKTLETIRDQITVIG